MTFITMVMPTPLPVRYYLGANYKNFDFSMFIQGVGQQYIAREGQLASPWYSGWTNQNATFWGNTWTAIDSTDARYPIMSRNGSRSGTINNIMT